MRIVRRQSRKWKNKFNCFCHCDFMTKVKKPKQTFLQTWGRGASCLQSNRKMKETIRTMFDGTVGNSLALQANLNIFKSWDKAKD
jgi:hypothetical protein